MEGGVALLLLLIIGAVAVVVGIGLYLTGGALLFSRRRETGDASPDPEQEPTHGHVVGKPRARG